MRLTFWSGVANYSNTLTNNEIGGVMSKTFKTNLPVFNAINKQLEIENKINKILEAPNHIANTYFTTVKSCDLLVSNLALP